MSKLLVGLLSAITLTLTLTLTVAVAPVATAADGDDFKVTLLGTGTPPPLMTQFGPATLVEVGGKTLLFDAGRGATQRMWQIKVPFGKLDQLFLTHLHSDHVVGIPTSG